jgi:hypothetical protein
MSCKPCGPSITSGPKPYYEEVQKNVVQNHETIIQQTKHAVGVLISEPWTVPELGEEITVHIEGVTVIPIGIQLHSPQYGYFRVAHWNPHTGQAGIVNDGIVGTAEPGTFVPNFIPFTPTPKPCCQDDTSTFLPFLAENFIAPQVNLSKDVDVTSVFGLMIGNYVRIGSGLYRLDEIKSSKRIRIFNKGAGHAPGAQVLAKDSNGEYQYLLTTEASYVCTADIDSTSGRLIICDAGSQKIITGSAVGQVMKLSDPVTGLAEYALISSSSINDGAVTTAKIANAAVDNSKLGNASVNTAKIANGAVDNLQLADGSISESKLQFNSVSTAIIQVDAVRTDRLLNNAVTNSKLADDAVTAAKILNGTVGTLEIADNAVTNIKIADQSITYAKLALGAVTSDIIQDGSVATIDLASGAVTSDKLGLNSVLPEHFGPLGAIGGFNSTLAIDTAEGGFSAAPAAYYYRIGNLILVQVVAAGTTDTGFTELKFSLPTATRNEGLSTDSEWPAFVTRPINAAGGGFVSAKTVWGVGGGTGGYIQFLFVGVGVGVAVNFQGWGVYPYK